MKVLLMSDTPSISTGMGRVHRELGRTLKRRGIDVVSIGWFTSPQLEDWKEWRVYRTNNMYYGNDVFDDVVMRETPDIVLTIGDVWMVGFIADPNRCRMRPYFQWVMYTPIDGEAYGGGIPVSWRGVLKDADVLVAYTEYGKRAISRSLPEIASKVEAIPHGVDTNVYKRFDRKRTLQLRRQFGIADDVIVYTMVVRNQFRKNIPEFCKGWKVFKNADGEYKKAIFWPHMCFKDQMGWDLWEVFDIYGMTKDLGYFKEVAQSQSNIDLVPEDQLVALYNASDVIVMMGGEGYGLPTLEAMACGKPVIAIKHSANIEIVEGRGELVEVQNYVTGSHSTERPIPNIGDLAGKLNLLYKNKTLREEYGQRGFEYAQKLTWENAGNMWEKLLRKVASPFSGVVVPERIC